LSKKELFIKNTMLMSVVAVLMRTVSVWFSIFLSKKLGEDGVGLYTLIMSVSGFTVTFATSAVGFAATRLVSEAIGRNQTSSVRVCMKKCIIYALFFGSLAFTLLFSLSKYIGCEVLDDGRCVLPLRILALSLPAIALSSCINGYFTAVRRVTKSAVSGIIEQMTRILATMMLITLIAPSDIEKACSFVVLGGVISDLVGLFMNILLYSYDIRRHVGKTKRDIDKKVVSDMLHIALPVAFSSYVRSGLSTLEHILVPKGLLKNGLAHKDALAAYGRVHGMALQVILYPYAFLTPFCSLLIPEIAGKTAAGDTEGVKKLTKKIYGFVLAFGIGCATFMGAFSSAFGSVVYGSAGASKYIFLLAPLVPVMYLDTATDSILKGMGEQLFCMKVNMLDSLLSVLIVFFAVPKFGIAGYVAEILFCETMNTTMSIARLHKRTKISINVARSVVFPSICAFLSVLTSKLILMGVGAKYITNGALLCAAMVIYGCIYGALLYFGGIITKNDISSFGHLIKKSS